MAKVTITFEDSEDGDVKIALTCDPPAKKGVERTRAQKTAFRALVLVTDISDVEVSPE